MKAGVIAVLAVVVVFVGVAAWVFASSPEARYDRSKGLIEP